MQILPREIAFPEKDKYWEYVDVRVNPDATFEIVFWPREMDTPTPLWIIDPSKPDKTPEGFTIPSMMREKEFYMMPMIERSGIKSLDMAIKHAKIYDLYFGARSRCERPDYGELLDYLKSISPTAWENIIKKYGDGKKKIESGTKRESDAEDDSDDLAHDRDFKLESDVVKEDKKSSPAKSTSHSVHSTKKITPRKEPGDRRKVVQKRESTLF